MSRLLKHWLPVALWMGAIFVLSGGTGSAEHSGRVLGWILHRLWPTIPVETVAQINFLCRKAGHLTGYAVLALLLCQAWAATLPAASARQVWRAAGYALVVAVLYAASDEWHQSFVPGRTASAHDVLIDGLGAAVAALLWVAFRSRRSAPAQSTSIAFPPSRLS